MTEDVERVAEALWRADAVRCGQPRRTAWEDEGPLVHEQWRPLARAAIAALREPSEAVYAEIGSRLQNLPTTLGIVWQAGIDAALGEREATE